jgi:predicted metal-dependent hydrolase
MIRSARRKLLPIGVYTTLLEEQTVAYNVKRSYRAKQARLEVRPGSGLTVVIPHRYNIYNLPELLKEKRRWILAKLAKYATEPPVTERKELQTGDTIPYLGRRLKLVTEYHPSAPVSVKLEKNRLLVNLKARHGRLNPVLEQWYRLQAADLIQQRAAELCPRLGVTYHCLTIRSARTRWGSCSRKGNLNFNWKLMMVPAPVIDYVIIHEMAHLKEMSHSKPFW